MFVPHSFQKAQQYMIMTDKQPALKERRCEVLINYDIEVKSLTVR